MEYFFLFELHSEESVYGKKCNYIKIQSNYFEVSDIVKEMISDLCLSIDNANNLKFTINTNIQIDRYLNNKKVNIDKIKESMKNNDQIIYFENSYQMNDFYDILLEYTDNLSLAILFENYIINLREYIVNLDEIYGKIHLKKILDSNELINYCIEAQINTLGDFLIKKPHYRDNDKIKEISLQIKKIDSITPKQIFDIWINGLKPSDYYVIEKRYLSGDNLTLEEIGVLCNVTRERIRQIEKKAFIFLLSTENQKYKNILMSKIKMLSPHESYITFSELEVLGLNTQIACFLEKLTGEIICDKEHKVCFFNESSKTKLEVAINDLPSEFTKTDLRNYCSMIVGDFENEFTEEELYNLIIDKCKIYGKYLIRGKLTLRVVFSFLLQKYFPEGIDLYEEKNIDLLRTKAFEEFNGFELADNNRAIIARLQDLCVLVNRGVWKYDTNEILISEELKELIIKYIESYNSPILPIQAILAKFQYQFNIININNKYALQGQLKKILPKEYSINRDYVIKSSENSFYTIIENFVRQARYPVTKYDIQRAFPGVSDIVIQQVAATTKVLNMNGYYVHLDNLDITTDEIQTLKICVDNVLCDKKIYHANSIFEKIKKRMSGLFARIGLSHYLQLYYLLHELFPLEYEYNRPFIAALGVEMINGETQVINLITQNEECDIATIRQYAKDVGTVIDRYIEFIDKNNNLFIFKNKQQVISIMAAGINEADFSVLDPILSKFMANNQYRLLSDFCDYNELPCLKCPWNTWLLYSIIKIYSESFKLVLTSNFLSDAKPVLVRKEFDEKNIDFAAMEKMDTEDSMHIDVGYDKMLDEFDYEDLE